jgi:hypothetical protein
LEAEERRNAGVTKERREAIRNEKEIELISEGW